jgi:GNAT superfamily N-acetyltransferase
MNNKTVETVVTYLAIEPPPRVLPPMPAGPRLALMKADRIPLHFYRYLYEQVGMSWLWFERLFLDDHTLARKVHRQGVEIFVLYGDGAPAGFYELDFGNPDRTNVVYFGLMPEWTGRKVGPWLLGTAVIEAFARGAKQATVNTCTLDHPAALPLYQRIGFVPFAREARRFHIPPNVPIPAHVEAR